MPTVSHLLLERALERGLRPSTVRSYQTLLGRLGLLEREAESVTREEVLELVWERVGSTNTRRATVIALRSVMGWDLKVPKGIPRRYALPDETTLRLILMQSPHEDRLLSMAYAGLRCGEAAGLCHKDVDGDRLQVVRQVDEHTGVVGPVKSSEASIVIPYWLAERLSRLEGMAKPASIRESLRRAGKKVGLDVNPHMLRHWYASHLLAQGVPLITVSRQLRHSDPSVTIRAYAQADDGEAIHDVLG